MTNRSRLRIRFAQNTSTPSDYLKARLTRDLDVDGYWILVGATDLLRGMVNAALAANDLNDYQLEPLS